MAAPSKPAPPPPRPATESYARLYQVVMRQRAGHFSAITYFISVCFLWLAMLDSINAFWNFLRVASWIMAGALWASAVVPIMLLRRSQLTAPRIHSYNRYSKIINVLTSGSFITSSFLCSISAVSLWMTYISSASALNNDPQLGLTRAAPGRGAPQVNERPIYLLVSSLYTAICYSFLGTFQGNWRYQRPDNSQVHLTIPSRIRKSIFPSVHRAQRVAFFCSVSFLPFYLVARRYVIRAIVFSKYVSLTKFIKPHLVMLIRLNSAFTLTSTVRLVILNLLIVSIWEILQACWDVYSTQPYDISQFHVEPNKCLLEGLQSPDPRIQYHAFYELAHLSWSNPARRVSIFKDIRSTPRILDLLIDECLKVIDLTTATVDNRGTVLSAAATPSVKAGVGAKSSNTPRLGYSALKDDLPQLFNNPPAASQPLRNKILSKFFSADDRAQGFHVSKPNKVGGTAASTQSQIPDVFQSPRRRHASREALSESDRPETVVALPSESSQVPSRSALTRGQKKGKVMPKPWRLLRSFSVWQTSPGFQQLEDWLFSPLITTELESCLSACHVFALAVEAVTNLTCASLTEDQYGVLQGRIPRLLKSLVDSCEALEKFHSEICQEFQIQPLSTDDEAPVDIPTVDYRTLDEFLRPMLDRLKDGIFGILDQFKPYLQEWPLDPRIDQWAQRRSRASSLPQLAA